MNLASHYNMMNKESAEAIQNDTYLIDKLIDSKSDQRFGITLLIRLNKPIHNKVQHLISRLKEIEPDQYYYPNSDLHVTALSIISCYQGFELSKMDVNQYKNLLTEELDNIQNFVIEFKGITLSNSGILIKEFPDPTLNQIRDQLRKRFKKSELQHSIDSRYVIKTAHSTLMRFRTELRNREGLIAMVKENNIKNLGTIEVKSLELVYI